METKLERIMKAGHRYMAIGSFRIVTGVASFGFALAAFFRRPRWMAWVALPSGILGLLMAVVIM